MAQPINAIAARASDADAAVAHAFDAQRERLAELARRGAEQHVPQPSVPTTNAETARPVAAASPTLSPDLRSMLMAPAGRQAPESASAKSSVALIGRLLDALRKYEQSS